MEHSTEQGVATVGTSHDAPADAAPARHDQVAAATHPAWSDQPGEGGDLHLVRSMALSSAELWHEVLRRLAEVQQSQLRLNQSIEQLTATVRTLVVEGQGRGVPDGAMVAGAALPQALPAGGDPWRADAASLPGQPARAEPPLPPGAPAATDIALPAEPPPVAPPGAATPWALAVWPPAGGGEPADASTPPDASPLQDASPLADASTPPDGRAPGEGTGGPATTRRHRRRLFMRRAPQAATAPTRRGRRARRQRPGSQAADGPADDAAAPDGVLGPPADDHTRAALEELLARIEQGPADGPVPTAARSDWLPPPPSEAVHGVGSETTSSIIPTFTSLLPPPPPPDWGHGESGEPAATDRRAGLVDAALDAARRQPGFGAVVPPEVPEPLFYVPPLLPEGCGPGSSAMAPPAASPSLRPAPPPPAGSLLPPPPAPAGTHLPPPPGMAGMLPPPPGVADMLLPPGPATDPGVPDLSRPFSVLDVSATVPAELDTPETAGDAGAWPLPDPPVASPVGSWPGTASSLPAPPNGAADAPGWGAPDAAAPVPFDPSTLPPPPPQFTPAMAEEILAVEVAEPDTGPADPAPVPISEDLVVVRRGGLRRRFRR